LRSPIWDPENDRWPDLKCDACSTSAHTCHLSLDRVASDRIHSFSRQTEVAFAVANALKQLADFN